MRFFTIAVTFVALADQVTLVTSQVTSCRDDIDPCFEVKISDTDQCNGDTVTYCLQRKTNPTITCKDTYSHANVWVAGNGVDLRNATLPTATCTDDPLEDPGTNYKDCDHSTSTSIGNNGCYELEGYPFAGGNNGLKCENVDAGLCVTVPLAADRTHAEVIFAMKDKNTCADDIENVVTCSNAPLGDDNTCACSGGLDACIFAGRTSCTRPSGGGGVEGDPHFKTWRGHRFDFHGECDLVLLHSSEFGSGLGLDVHVRTKLRRDMSYISSATLRIGTDILEVESQGIYYLNGVVGAELPNEFSGFAFSHTQPTEKQHVFEMYLGDRERIKVKTYKDFVSVLIEQGQSKHFGDSVGLMGDFGKGRMLARDGQTILDDANAFGQEWQVLDTESNLFQTIRFPQHPSVCTLPPPIQASQLRRRLLESSVDERAAEMACAHWGEGKDNCVFDVLTTGDLEMAVVGAY
jgi:hypothetical protein